MAFFKKTYSIEKIRLAFEYGLTIQRVAYEQKVEMTPEIVERAERVIESEFKSQTPTFLALNMVPIILSIFELDLSK